MAFSMAPVSVLGLSQEKRVSVAVIERNSIESTFDSSTIASEKPFNARHRRMSSNRSIISTTTSISYISIPSSSGSSSGKDDPQVGFRQRTNERCRIAYTFANSALNDLRTMYQPISNSHVYSRRLVEPLYTWNGRNTRVITGRCLGSTTIQNGMHSETEVINAACQSYLGLNESTVMSEDLQKVCLETLPITDPQGQSALSVTFKRELSEFLDLDFCFTTGTGYTANMLAIPAIVNRTWLVAIDSKANQSLQLAASLSNYGKLIKFKHNNMSHLMQLLLEEAGRFERMMVITEGLFSIDGTVPPLAELQQVKKCFNFTLVVDEAHSIMTIGRTGRGCLEFWNDTYLEAPVDEDLIDVRTATLSKSFGAIGGVVCGKSKYNEAISTRHAQLLKRGEDSMLTTAMVQCLRALWQPNLISRRIERTKEIAGYARSELQRCGLHIYGDPTMPIVPVHVGRPTLAARMSFVLRQKKVLANPVTRPLTSKWSSRIQVCFSADHTDKQVTAIVKAIYDAARECGILHHGPPRPAEFTSVHPEPDQGKVLAEERGACHKIRQLLDESALASKTQKLDRNILKAGHACRHRHGLATGGPRWGSGTYSVHANVEELISKAIHVEHALTMTYADTYLGMVSTIAALCRPIYGNKTHVLLLPKDVPEVVLEGVNAAPKRRTPGLKYYTNLDELAERIDGIITAQDQVTVYIEADKLTYIQLYVLANKLKRFGDLSKSLTIFFHDSGKALKTAWGQECLQKLLRLAPSLTRNVLVYGSFMENFGVPGAYLTGSQQIVEEFRYSSQGYMFSSSPLPFVMGMVEEQLRYPSEQ